MPSQAEELSMSWEQYSYRHSHIWRLVFQLTTAAVALSIVPYLDAGGSSGWLTYIPPVTAAILVSFGARRLRREFNRFDSVKAEFLKRTGKDVGESTFRRDTLLYVWALLVFTFGHAVLLIASRVSEPLRTVLDLNLGK